MKLILYMECDAASWSLDYENTEAIIKGFNADQIINIGVGNAKDVLNDFTDKVNAKIYTPFMPCKTSSRLQSDYHIKILKEENPDIYLALHKDITKSKLIIKSITRAFKAGKPVFIHNGVELKTFSDYFPNEVVDAS
jgi:hypothetical protein